MDPSSKNNNNNNYNVSGEPQQQQQRQQQQEQQQEQQTMKSPPPSSTPKPPNNAGTTSKTRSAPPQATQRQPGPHAKASSRRPNSPNNNNNNNKTRPKSPIKTTRPKPGVAATTAATATGPMINGNGAANQGDHHLDRKPAAAAVANDKTHKTLKKIRKKPASSRNKKRGGGHQSIAGSTITSSHTDVHLNNHNDDDDSDHDDDDDDDDLEETRPLTESAAAITRKKKKKKKPSAFEIVIPYRRPHHHHHRVPQHEKQQQQERNRIMASVVFFCVVVTPILAGFGFFNKNSNNNNTVVFIPNCDQIQFNQTFEELMIQAQQQKASDDDSDGGDFALCNADIVKAWHLKKCDCPANPTIGRPMVDNIGERWQAAWTLEKKRVAAVKGVVDVALVGDSITEHWLGTDLGKVQATLEGVVPVFESLFTRQGGGKIEGVVLGIAAERTGQVLYRLQHGALGSGKYNKLSPKVFWLTIGTNDMGGLFCSVDNVVAGTIAIVQELQQQRPESIVVVNGILPRPDVFVQPIQQINERMSCYASMTPGVEYFNASSIFPTLPNGTIANLADQLHPSVEGHRLWGEQIVRTVLALTTAKTGSGN